MNNEKWRKLSIFFRRKCRHCQKAVNFSSSNESFNSSYQLSFLFSIEKKRNLLNVTISQMSLTTGWIGDHFLKLCGNNWSSLGRAIIVPRKTDKCCGKGWSAARLLLQRKLGWLWGKLWLSWGLYKRICPSNCCSVGPLCMDKTVWEPAFDVWDVWSLWQMGKLVITLTSGTLRDHFDKRENLWVLWHGDSLWLLRQGDNLWSLWQGDNLGSLWQGGQLVIALTRGTTWDCLDKGDNLGSL